MKGEKSLSASYRTRLDLSMTILQKRKFKQTH